MRYTTTVHPAEANVPAQEFGSIPVEEHPLYDEKGRLVSTDVPGQDQMTWVAQGPIVDRTRENLGVTDAGIILFRKVMEENLRIVEDGGDPMNTFRDPAQNECVLLPNEAAPFPGFDEPGGPWHGVMPRTPDVEVSLL